MPLPHKKNFLRDVLPKNSSDNSVTFRKVREDNDIVYHKVSEPVIDYSVNNSGGGGRWRIWSLVAVAVFGLTLAIFYVFSSAEVVLIPRVNEAKFDKNFKAEKLVVEADSISGSNLRYSISQVQKIGSKSLDADGEKLVNRKSSGTIVIYNKFSDQPQKLIKNTRFETSDGLIFRIDRSVVIPGKTIVDGKVIPGSVEAVVYADEPGVKYNIGLTDFTIPGFKTDKARYAGFYATSKTPMLDGFSGKAKYVSDAKQKLARAEIRGALEKRILEEVKSGLSKDIFIPKGAYTIEFETQPSVDAEGGKVALKEKAIVSVYTFKIFDWDQFLGSETSFKEAIGSSTVEILNRDDLEFVWLSRPKADSSEISFRVNGNVEFGWMIDSKKIMNSLAGKKREDLEGILKNWGGVVNATATFSPFWRSSFPSNPDKIKIVIKMPEN